VSFSAEEMRTWFGSALPRLDTADDYRPLLMGHLDRLALQLDLVERALEAMAPPDGDDERFLRMPPSREEQELLAQRDHLAGALARLHFFVDAPDREWIVRYPPAPEATLELVQRRLAEEGTLPFLTAALSRARVIDMGTELETVLGEIYDSLARHRTAIKLLDRCASDYPELAKLWYRAGREGALSLLGRYLDDRARRGRLRRFEDGAVAARIVLETLVFWAVHRHWDPSPQALDEGSARRTVLFFLTAALVKEPR